MKLFCDHMLGSLAKWLRIFGFDTVYPDATMNDDIVLQIAKREKRLLISRDNELLIRAKKALVPVLEIHTTDLTEQLQLVLKETTLDEEKILTRCTLCNTPLHSIAKEAIKDQIPEKVFQTRNEFWFCPSCSKYYWMGTHYENMREKINTLIKKESL
ncbi:MAG TPA: Mut7-C RNAse domain-containing protein [Candidatus Thermoplasmatota archaeon]|nr:Mut7-C RNAse domain-containing protein [Candidatus Thermoplasmatota archaeon]